FGTGGVLEQDFRDNTYFTTTGRISYESKPANIYYLEAALGHRVHESKFDSTNGKRDATTYNLTVGSEFELSEKLNGNYSIGYQIDDYEDSSLKSLDGFTLNGGINWSPQREVNVSVNAQTSFTEAANSTTPGSIVRSIDGTITRQATQRLQLNATGGVRLTYDEKNNLDSSVWNVGSGFEYAINKHMSFKGSVDYEEQTNEETSVSIDNTTFSTSLKLQR
ncbi:MAG: outer membrane beta-barrel protein, partial [Nitratireductor sp.]